ncbi:hypothetical protein TeGR_g1751, partial [Tetraparma gracilis]
MARAESRLRGFSSKDALLLLDDLLSLVAVLFSTYQRCSEIDTLVLAELATRFRASTTAPTVAEKALIDKSLANEDHDWARLKGTVTEPVEYFQALADDNARWGRAEANVDASAEDLVAWVWHSGSYGRLAYHVKEDGDTINYGLEVPGSNSRIHLFGGKFPLIDDRVFGVWFSWMKESGGGYVVAFASHRDYPAPAYKEAIDTVITSHKSAAKAVEGKVIGFYRFSPLAANVSRVTFVARGSLEGLVPDSAMKYGLKRTLMVVDRLRDKYERNGKSVDAELRGDFPPPPNIGQLGEEQRRIAQSCMGLETGSATVEWVKLKSASPFVELGMKYSKPFGDEASVALGKAKSTLDCSATDAFAYQVAVCGREKMRIGWEEGDRARLIFKEHAKHDFEWASVKKMPFPLTNREFLARCLSFKGPTGDLVLVFEALPDSTKVDYGADLKVVRGKTTGVYRFKSINDDTQCEVTLVQHGDAGGFVPERVMVAKIPQALGGVAEMRELFQRDDAIDDAERSELAFIIKAKNEVYTDAENAVVNRIRDQLGEISDNSFEKIESPDYLVYTEVFPAGGKNGIARASTVLDDDICTCVAWTYQLMARHFVKAFYADGGMERAVTTHNDHSFTGQLLMDLNIPTVSPREFVTRSVWWWESETVLLVATESCLAEQYPRRPGIVRASVVSLQKFEQLDPIDEIPQTRVMFMQQPDMGGFIPSRAVRAAAVGQMMYLSTMRKHFDKSPAIDAASNVRLATMIENHDNVYSAKEEAILEEGKKMLEVFEQQKSKELKMASPTTQAKMAFKDGNNHVYGWSTAVVRASPAQVLAFVWNVQKRTGVYADDLEKTVDEDGEHNKLVYIKKKVPNPFDNRDFLSRTIWRKRAAGFIFVSVPELSDAHPLSSDVVRARYPSLLKMTGMSDGSTQLEYVTQPDLGGALPLWLVRTWMGSSLAWVTEIQHYFGGSRGLEEYDAKDGEAVGEVLVTKTDAEQHHGKGETRVEARVRELTKKQKGLKELGQKHEWFEVLLTKIVENKLRPAGDSRAKLCNMSAKEAKVIGGALASCIAANLTAPAAVDEWILRYPAMGELER